MEEKKENIQTVKMKLIGLHCTGCATNLALILEDIPGVLEANTDYARAEAVVTFDSLKVKPEIFIEEIKKAGYEAEATP